MAAGTKDDSWELKTPPGTSSYIMYRDEQADPPALVCQVGSTTLKYHLRAIDDLQAWLARQGDWVPLVADLTGVTMLASAGVRALYAVSEQMAAQGQDLTLVTAPGSAAHGVLDLVRLAHVTAEEQA